MKTGFLQWLNEHLTFSRQRDQLHDALRESDELNEAKRAMTQYSRDLEAGRAGPVLPIKRTTMEKAFLGYEKGGERA